MEPPGPAVLDEPTLVLNRSWIPINTVTVRQALTLVIKGSAAIIQPDTYEIHDFDRWRSKPPLNGDAGIHGVGFTLRLPEIIVLSRYDRLPLQQVPFTRRNLFRRDGHRCQYCGSRKGLDELSIDHVIPRSRGGGSNWENCVLACLRCNVKKGDRLPETVGMAPIRRPSRPEWSPCLGVQQVKRRDSWRRFISDHQWRLEF